MKSAVNSFIAVAIFAGLMAGVFASNATVTEAEGVLTSTESTSVLSTQLGESEFDIVKEVKNFIFSMRDEDESFGTQFGLFLDPENDGKAIFRGYVKRVKLNKKFATLEIYPNVEIPFTWDENTIVVPNASQKALRRGNHVTIRAHYDWDKEMFMARRVIDATQKQIETEKSAGLRAKIENMFNR